MFKTYNDWFYFIHIDPAQRIVHAFGMFAGSYFFIMLFLEWSFKSIVYYLLGVFFFYVLGIISHLIYDKGTAKSDPKYFIPTFIPVIKFNILTSLGIYDNSLRRFCDKYPFTVKAYDLVEINGFSLIPFLLGKMRDK